MRTCVSGLRGSAAASCSGSRFFVAGGSERKRNARRRANQRLRRQGGGSGSGSHLAWHCGTPATTRPHARGAQRASASGAAGEAPGTQGQGGLLPQKQAFVESDARLRYLEALVSLRTLYRSFLRAQYWLDQPHPLLSSHPSHREAEPALAAKDKREKEEEAASAAAVDEEEQLAFALDAVAEMALTSDQLGSQLKKLPLGFSAIFETLPLEKCDVFANADTDAVDVSASGAGAESGDAAPADVSAGEAEGGDSAAAGEGQSQSRGLFPAMGAKGRKKKTKKDSGGSSGKMAADCFPSIEGRILSFGNNLVSALGARLELELDSLPFQSRKEAWSAIRKLITSEEEVVGANGGNGGEGAAMAGDDGTGSGLLQGQKVVFRRVIKAEKAAVGKLVKRVRASSKGWQTMQDGDGAEGGSIGRLKTINQSANYMKGVWIRLNGGGKQGLDLVPLPESLPRPTAISKKARDAFKLGTPSEIVSIEVDRLDKEFKEASKVRETKLRKAGVLERARMDVGDLKEAEDTVNDLRSQLAMKTLELEMQLVFEYLEKEALSINDENSNFLPWRRGSSEELTLLVAEYALLDRKMASLITVGGLGGSGAAEAGGSNGGNGERDEELWQSLMLELAVDVPDLRSRLGITDGEVVYMSLDTRIKNVVLTVNDSTQKVKEGVAFMGTGTNLLVTDLATCGKLFWRALLGGTLQPREVETLRRTARDMLTFVPFIVILILPITPVGHVLVFSFIQQNFPALFPSQFTSARQKSMKRYVDLKKQLDEALEQEGLKWREEQFVKAVEAVEALTSNVAGAGTGDNGGQGGAEGIESEGEDAPGQAGADKANRPPRGSSLEVALELKNIETSLMAEESNNPKNIL